MAEGKIKRHLDWQEVAIADILPYKNNPKAHSKEQIAFVADLIKTYGWTQPLCLDNNYEIVFGHCRLESAKLNEEATVPCVFREDLTEAQVKALRIADNKSNESDWIEERLEIELVELQAMDVDLQDVGFGPEEAPGGGHIKEDDFDVDGALEEEPITEAGDLWHLGSHRILCGDSTKREDAERLMDGKKADMVFTDPPYGMGKDFENDALSDMREFHSSWMRLCGSISAKLVWYDPKNISDVIAPGETLWGHMEDYLHLYKPNDVAFPRRSWIRKSESMIIFGSPIYIEIKPYAHDTYLWNHTGKDKSFYHPSVKPMEVVVDVLSRFEAGVIYDPFLGSGTTLIAADQLDRTCYGMEIEPRYVDVTVKRYIKHKGSDEDVYLERDGVKIPYSEVMANV